MELSPEIIVLRDLMDGHDPTWRERVNPDELYMMDPFKCVFGQAFGSYITGLKSLDIEDEHGRAKYNISPLLRRDYIPQWRYIIEQGPATPVATLEPTDDESICKNVGKKSPQLMARLRAWWEKLCNSAT